MMEKDSTPWNPLSLEPFFNPKRSGPERSDPESSERPGARGK